MNKDSNRLSMPSIALIVDELRQWAPGLTVKYACENGIELGIKGDEGVVPVIEKRIGNLTAGPAVKKRKK